MDPSLRFDFRKKLRFGIKKNLEAGKSPHGKSPKRFHLDRHCKKIEVRFRQAGKIGEVLHNRDFTAKKNRVRGTSSVPCVVNVHGIYPHQRHLRRGQKLRGVPREVGMPSKYCTVFQCRDHPVSISTALPANSFSSGKWERSIARSPAARIFIAGISASCSSRNCERSLPSAKRWNGESRYVPVFATISILPM